jgi:hypothetical protein
MVLVKLGPNLVNPDRILWLNVTDNAALVVFGDGEDFRILSSDKQAWQELTDFLGHATMSVSGS